MSRLIDAEALKKKIRREYHPMDEIPFFEIMHIISNAPTIEERPKGNWIKNEFGYECSECSVTSVFLGGKPHTYCHWCGAKMSDTVQK